MKRYILIIIFYSMFSSLSAHSQGIKEWFSQKQTQRQYLMQQIVALKMYGSYLQKGYTIVKDGLNTIGSLKNGHVSLDKIFFNRLQHVSLNVKSNSRASEIILLQSYIDLFIDAAIKMIQKSPYFSSNELRYIKNVLNDVRKDCDQLTHELNRVLDNGNYEMSDDERIRRILLVYKEVKERHEFIQTLSMQLAKMELQKRLAQKDIHVMNRIYPD
ncbi:hypothetical protein [Niabella ginsengisoli]|uniref:TerB family tellurite resistance protein n=1 Tax=Niabella ginsengisoli TaxID=522298 RepID=A0ABS9SHZ5_9BACT|nr:hypothetical protein [Niabella ginsengisoli]MCH5597936.1 hypothetical protein [Niabella ginsengisoli]